MRLLSIAALLWPPLLGANPPECRPVARMEAVQQSLSQHGHRCFVLHVDPGETVHVAISQPVDLSISVAGTALAAGIVDAFDFGEETAVLADPGKYRLEIRPVAPGFAGKPVFALTQRLLDPQRAALWRTAESAATAAKQSLETGALRESLRRWQQIGDPSRIARTYLMLGGAALRSGNAGDARVAYEEAYRICDETADVRCRAEAANNAGLAARRLGDIEQARRRLEQAEADWRAISLPQLAAITLSNLGLLLRQTGELQAAIGSYDRARGILASSSALDHARVFNNLGLCYLSLTEYEKAQAYFELALVQFARRKSAGDEVRARLNLGRTNMLRGRLETAQRLLEQAAAQAGKTNDRAALADSLNNLGQTLLKRGAREHAKLRLESALELHRAIRDRRGVAAVHHHLGLLAMQSGDARTAREQLTQAAKIRNETGLRDDAAASLSALAEVEYEAGRLDAARAFAEQSLALVESVRSHVPGPALRASYYHGVRRTFDVLVDIVMDTDAPDRVAAGLLASERGRAQALLDAITEHARMSAAPPDLLSRQREIQRKLNWLSLRLASGAEAEEAGLRRQVQLLLAENQETEARLRQAAAPGALDRQALSLAHLRAALPDDCALVEYHLGTRRSYLWMLDHQQLRVFPLPRRAAVEAQVSRAAGLFGNILERRRSPSQQQSFEAAMRDLSATLLGPLQGNKLPPCVVVAPDGPLHSAPFAALREPSGGQPLGLSRELIQIPAAAYLVKGKEPRPVSRFPKAILAIADPVFSRDDPRVTRKSGNRRQPDAPDLARLPFADELNTITRLLPDSRRRILRGFEATPDALRNARLADYGILHFSTHALIDNEIPEMSRIALSLVDSEGNAANGFLEPYELAQWRLEGSTVALSACETALGKQVLGEGMAGLASSLFYAGAARLIATLAKVDDEASSEFFGEVYSRLLAPQPVRLETALALARRRLSQSPRWADPYYWASFVLMGRPSL